MHPPYNLQVEIGCFVSSKAEDIDNSHINNDNLSVDQRVAKGKVEGVRFNKEAGRYFVVGDAVTVRVLATQPELVLAVDKKFIKPLLILDIHGVLGEREPWTQTKSRKREREFITRPFCDEFLEFCFERFEVAGMISPAHQL